MNSEKLKQIRESITNTVSCLDAHNGDDLTNKVLNDHLKTLTDMEAAFLGTIHIHEPSSPVFISGEHIVVSGELLVK